MKDKEKIEDVEITSEMNEELESMGKGEESEGDAE